MKYNVFVGNLIFSGFKEFMALILLIPPTFRRKKGLDLYYGKFDKKP